MAIQGKNGELRVVTKKPRAKPVKRARKIGVEQLRKEADNVLRRKSKKLAVLLGEKAMTGDLNTVKVLVGLAEKKKPEPERKPEVGPVKERPLTAWIKRIANEPHWEWEDDDAKKTHEELKAEELADEAHWQEDMGRDAKERNGRWVLRPGKEGEGDGNREQGQRD